MIECQLARLWDVSRDSKASDYSARETGAKTRYKSGGQSVRIVRVLTDRQNHREDTGCHPICKEMESRAWGAAEIMPESWRRKRYRQIDFVRPHITEGTHPSGVVLCDIAAGAGYYTLAYAHLFRIVLHCDLSMDNLNYARREARRQGIRNIFFLRVDYFALPFRRSLDRVLCLDTLIRGEAHDSIVLAAVASSLKPAGYAVVDFHNWWHNPARRLGLLPENFHNNRSYGRSKTSALLRLLGVDNVTCSPFVQEFDAGTLSGRFIKRVLPATRLVYRFASPGAKSRPPSMAVA